MTAREILKILHKDGWYEVDQDGSHMQLKHPTKPGKVTVAIHGKGHTTGNTQQNMEAGRALTALYLQLFMERSNRLC